jgi:tripartite-type tricarboxylate transporter receptor subunit TctC
MAETGLTTDVLVRALIIGANKYMGRQFIVEAKPGSGGMLAASLVSAAKPDGYTLFSGASTSVIEGALMQKAPFKPLKSFTPIMAFALSEHTATAVAPDAPWKTFKEFIDYVKKNPGKVKVGISPASGMHIAMEYVKHQDNLNWVNVPFTSSGPATTAVMGHHIDAVAMGSNWPEFAEAGQLRILVTHGKTRSPRGPNIPNLIELGYNYAGQVYQTFLGPAGMPRDVAAKLETAFTKGQETPEFKAAMAKLYQTNVSIVGKDFDSLLRERWTTMEKFFKQFGIIKEAATQPE